MQTFLHVDMDAFYASIEQRDHPELKGTPVVVGSPPDQRGVVSAASYEARRFGIHSAMPSSQAGQRCPHATFLPVDMPRYQAESKRIFSIFEQYTPLIEPLSIDEAFLDVTGAYRIHGTGEQIAVKIRRDILEQTGLTASIGVAHNKFLAKLASDLDKPDGLTLVPRDPDEVRDFLAPLTVNRIWGVGKVTGATLDKAGIHTIGQLQEVPVEQLAKLVGEHSATHLSQLAFGEDSRDIQLEQTEKSISREHTFGRDCRERERVRKVLVELVEDVSARLRNARKYATVVQIKLRWKGFHTITRQKTLGDPTCDTFRLLQIAGEIFDVIPLDKPVRLIGFGLSGLQDSPGGQMLLFDASPAPGKPTEKLSHTMDQIRDKYGTQSINRASIIPEPEN
jgi:DNA polymerase-4